MEFILGVAAYNRGSKLVSRQIESERLSREFEMMDDLNALPKRQGASTPWGPVHFVAGHGGWWAQCPTTGFGYLFDTLRQAVTAYNVTITAIRFEPWGEVTWIAVPGS